MEAKYYSKGTESVQCHLCPHECTVAEGRTGLCQVRKNEGGELVALSYGLLTCMALDPIEKKPLYHYKPGAKVLSVGSVGCNFRCQFCQNHTISQAVQFDLYRYEKNVTPVKVASKALELRKSGNIGVAFTYNEPIVGFEFMVDVAAKVKADGMVNVVVTNGFIQPQPLAELLPLTDAFNIDLKSYSDEFYHRMLGGRMAPVERTLVAISKAGKHLEVTYLVIPGENDDRKHFRELCLWIKENLSSNVVLHINRYFPNYHLNLPPTTLNSMIDLYGIAREHLANVYLGNTGLSEYSNTYCPKCGKLLVERKGMDVSIISLTKDGRCSGCGASAW